MQTTIELKREEDRIRPEKSEVERLRADNSKAQRLAGWKPAYAGLVGFKAGIKETVEWFSAPDNLRLYKANFYNI